MPTKPKNKKNKSGHIKKKSLSKEAEMAELDALLNDPVFMKSIEDKNVQEPKRKTMGGRSAAQISRTGADNARIGMEGFKAATNNPEMFEEAMGMLNDPNAVLEAQQMMNDPDFKREIQKHMANLKMDPSFQLAMETAQSKFQELLKEPEKLKEIQAQNQGGSVLSTEPAVILSDPGIDTTMD